MTQVFKPIVLDTDGVFSQLPNGAIVNIGGTTSSTFTVGGRGLLFDDGSSTSGNVGGTTLQGAYDNSISDAGKVEISLSSNKSFRISSLSGKYFELDFQSGSLILQSSAQFDSDVSIAGNLTLVGTINNIDIGLLKSDLDNHIAGEVGYRHLAADIDILPISNLPDAINVQEALEQICSKFSVDAYGYEHIQLDSSPFWTIEHNSNSKRAQITIYNDDYEQIISEQIKILDENTILISFAQPISGIAIVILF